ncbi:signal recognition particle receptor beta subunit-domain-containing protein [Lipomyces oligophaga]|uniref:signal recognition particle receptor beta subunit-domain-containing protein n=1 Tax=Lipomyces oligophaga TaxID=45792 RepID=UPI0034CEE4B2
MESNLKDELVSTATTTIRLSFAIYVLFLGIFLIVGYYVFELLFRKAHGAAAGGPTFIIAGPSGSGKTALFSLLRYDEKPATLPSLEPNISTTYRLPNLTHSSKNFVLIDTPGHPKLRHGTFETIQIALKARTIHGILFVVDASVMSNLDKRREAAEYLYDILCLTERITMGVDIAIAANKSELFTAMPPKQLRTTFETEMDKIRQTRSKLIGKVGLDDEKSSSEADEDINDGANRLGLSDGSAFSLAQLESEVVVIAGSVKTGKVEDWVAWMEERALNK